MGSKFGPTIEDYAKIVNSRANLLFVLEARCEAVPEEIVARINNCEDVAVLQAWMHQAARVNAIEEFRPE